VTEAIDGLERDGLVQRTPDARDRRVKQVSITEEGRRVIGETEPLRQELIESIFGVLSDDERKSLGAMMRRMIEALDVQDALR
jgi:DNA-binding MarR family transcriptional regulator